MVTMHIIRIFSKWLFVVCMPVMLLTASVTWTVNNASLYRFGFDKYDVGETTGLEQTELKKAADGLIDYFNSGEELIDVTVMKNGKAFQLFNEREISHLKDVKGLFRAIYWLLLGTLVYSLAYAGVSLFLWKDRRGLAQGLVYGSGLTLLLMAALGIGALIDFDGLFRQFHLISFTNDLWMLNPATDYLIMLFPRGFWYDAALFWSLSTAMGALVLGSIGLWCVKKLNTQDRSRT
jgi:integral membrane protein (TIGR01906 family)